MTHARHETALGAPDHKETASHMPPALPPLRLTNAQVLRGAALTPEPLTIAEGLIDAGARPAAEVDLSGYLVLPGIIDLHGDAFERHVAPRPTAPFPFATGLASTDRDAAAHGVTTAWLAQSWSWEGGHRGPDHAAALAAALETYRPQAGVDLRLQIRCETHMLDGADRLLDLIRRHRVGYVVFNNHLPEALEIARGAPARLEGWAAQSGRTGAQMLAVVHAAMARAAEVPRHLCRLAEAFDAIGVAYGSHDDPDAATRDYFRGIGAKICEFPTRTAPARAAHAEGDPVLMGAPNVLRGGSQSGNVAAVDLVAAGLCSALVSDYYYPALAGAAFRLADDGVLPLARAWGLVSSGPADVIGLADRGRLAPGMRADVAIVNATTRLVEATIAGGRLVHLTGEAAARFLAAPARLALAAE